MYLFLYFLYYPVRELFSQQLPRCFFMGASSKNSSLDFVWVGAAAPSLLQSSGWVSTPQSPAKLLCPPSSGVCVTHPSASLDGAGGPWLAKRSQPRPSCSAGNSPAVLSLLAHSMVSAVKSAFPALSLHFPCSLPALCLLWSHPSTAGHSDRHQDKSCPQKSRGNTS